MFWLFLVVACSSFNVIDNRSVFKLSNSNVFLASYPINYGSGSHEQSVSALAALDDDLAFWQIVGSSKCGSQINLMHLESKRFLNSHGFPAMDENLLEVSVTESAAPWIVECGAKKSFSRGSDVFLRHSLNNCYLAINRKMQYHHPINGHYVVGCLPARFFSSSRADIKWTADLGVFFASHEKTHDEL